MLHIIAKISNFQNVNTVNDSVQITRVCEKAILQELICCCNFFRVLQFRLCFRAHFESSKIYLYRDVTIVTFNAWLFDIYSYSMMSTLCWFSLGSLFWWNFSDWTKIYRIVSRIPLWWTLILFPFVYKLQTNSTHLMHATCWLERKLI